MKLLLTVSALSLAPLLSAAPLSQATTARTVAQNAGQAVAEADETIEPTLKKEWVTTLNWRSVGPANMGGRIIDLEVYENDPKVFWAATASGGILKTTNNGVTFKHQFENENTVSVGDMAISQSNPDIVWVGTGEQNPRNSVSWGDGVYKSTDGGDTWNHMGLKETFQVGKILIHPDDDNTVFVGALGRLWGPNEQRGLFKTTDGGENWQKILYVDENTGVIDMGFHPENPDVILVAMWERARDEFDTNDPAKRWGPGSGLYRTDDGGASWKRITSGMPSTDLGRMSIRFSGVNPDTVYLLVDTDKIGTGIENPGYLGMSGRDAEVGATISRVTNDGPAEKAGLKVDDIVIGVNDARVLDYQDLLAELRKRQAGDAMTLQLVRDGDLMEIDVELAEHPNPNEKPFGGRLGGQSADIQDQQGEDGVETGGLFRSDDGGENWTRINSINPRPMYFSKVYADPSDDNNMWVCGVPLFKSQDNGATWTSDGTPGIVHVDHHAMWINPSDGEHILLGNDGGLYVTYDRGATWDHLDHAAIGQFYHVTVDNQPLYNIYGGLQDNGSWGGPNRTRTGDGTYNTDWFRVGGGDGFICEVDRDDPDQIYYSSQNGGLGRVHLKTGERRGLRPRAPRGTTYRWNWRTPYMLSHHNSDIYYAAGNHVFRSFHKGDDMKRISPEITRTRRGSATAFDESPIDPDLMMVGSDDGALWVTRDGGREWENLLFPFDAEAYAEPTDAEKVEALTNPQAARASRAQGQGRGDTPAPAARGAGGDREAAAGGGRAGGRFAAMLERFDTNKDGKLQRDEAPERMAGFFDRLDRDSNGELDAAEMQAMAGGRRGAAGGGGGGGQSDAPRERPAQPQERAAEQPVIAEAAPAQAAEPTEQAEADDEPKEPFEGVWESNLVGGQAGGNAFFITLKRIGEKTISAAVDATVLDASTDAGTIDNESGEMRFTLTGPQGEVEFECRLDGDKLAGTLVFAQGGFEAQFEGVKVSGQKQEAEAGPTIASLVDSPKRVSCIEWSKFDRNRVYITLDGHYTDDDDPHVFVSDDAGKTWRSLRSNLPEGTTRIVREDIENQDVLYLGTEFALWASVDRGRTWTRLNSNLPTVAIHEIAQHETSGELILGTHGRSIWIADISAVRQMSEDSLAARATLYDPNDVTRWRREGSRGRGANRWFAGQNPREVATIYYSLARNASDLRLEVFDAAGRPVKTLELPDAGNRAGFHFATWDLRSEPPAQQQGRFRRGRLMPPGEYRVVLRAGNVEQSQTFHIRNDPTQPGVTFAEDEFFTELYAEEEAEYSEQEDETRDY